MILSLFGVFGSARGLEDWLAAHPESVAVPLALAVAFGAFHLINDVLRVPLPVGPWGL